MVYGGVCNCGPTCACVGCPVRIINLVIIIKKRRSLHIKFCVKSLDTWQQSE